MKTVTGFAVIAALTTILAGCGESPAPAPAPTGGNGGTHTHADGTVHSNDAHQPAPAPTDHAHDEVSIGKATLGGDIEVELWQGHGKLEAGKESHLVVKLPYSDGGKTIVRAWIGTDDRTLSSVGLGTYSASHDDYDIHAMAPDPLPANVQWWIEIEKPDDETMVIGSATPRQ